MAVGVASVIVLSTLGEAARRYVSAQFASLGTHLLIILPGRAETSGADPTLFMGETTRDLTLSDAEALVRAPGIRRLAPINIGAAPVSRKGLTRDVILVGTTRTFLDIRHLEMAQGRFLDADTGGRQNNAVCVLGNTIKKELFGIEPAVGRWLRIAGRRFRVIGVLASEGTSLGINSSELVLIPVSTAQAIFNTESLFRILVEVRSQAEMDRTSAKIIDLIRERHQGERDITIVTQDTVMATFNDILHTLTLGVAGIAAISLLVAGILIMNVMLISISQRTPEIGLLKALGATKRQISTIFLAESALLSLLGAGIGLIIALSGNSAITHWFPELVMTPPLWAILAAIGVALITGLFFGIIPARRAAGLDPVVALQRR